MAFQLALRLAVAEIAVCRLFRQAYRPIEFYDFSRAKANAARILESM